MVNLNACLWHTRNQAVPNMSYPDRLYDINIHTHQVHYQRDQRILCKEPDICHARLVMRKRIMEILFPTPTPHDRDQIDGLVKILEEILYKEAASEEEFANQETLKHRLQQLTNRLQKNPYSSDCSIYGASSARLDVHGSNRAHIDEAAMTYKRTMNYGASVDPSICYQRDLNHQSYRHQMQGEKMAVDAGKILRYQRFLLAYVCYKFYSQHGVTNLPSFSKLQYLLSHITRCKEKKCRCGEYSQLLNHYYSCQDGRCPICESARNHSRPRTFDRGVQKPIIGTRQSLNDQDYNRHTIDHSEETWPPLKRHKIENPYYASFAANETSEVWVPIAESGFPQGIQQNHQKLDGYSSGHSEYAKSEIMKVSLDRHTQNITFFTEFRYNEQDGVPIDLSNPQGFPKMHQQLYGPLHDASEFGEYEVMKASMGPFAGIGQDIPDATEIRYHGHVTNDQPRSTHGVLQMGSLSGPLCADSKHAESKGMEVSLDHLMQDTSTVTEIGYNEQACSPDDVPCAPQGLSRCHQQLDGPSYVNTEHVGTEVKKSNLDLLASQAQDDLTVTAARGNNQELDESHSPEKLHQLNQQDNKRFGFDSEYVEPDVLEARMDYLASHAPGISNGTESIKDDTELDGEPIVGEAGTQEDIHVEAIFNSINPEVKDDHVSAAAGEGTEFENLELKGVSLIESFIPEQINKHIVSLRQWVGQSKGKVEKNQAQAYLVNEDSCQLCSVEHLSFQPLIYCSLCGVSIKKKIAYYASLVGDVRYLFCQSCYKKAQGESITVCGNHINKARLEKKKNEETIEPWVQCDKCDRWQHQICALFNEKRNEEGGTEYICPKCYVEKINSGECKPLQDSAIPGAKDLPRTMLSDFIEERLSTRLKAEREERAMAMGKSYDEVPGAEDLVVRVVLSVNKKLQVKQYIRDALQEENYPSEFPYKSKVILLFQKIEGVEVCLLGMYTQEFGSECAYPNQRFISLSYLDSVKYFRPETKTVTGEALRTFVYHEILIGYLDYCKRRGFSRCYIWSCPPRKADNYILYCHPEIQKIPKPEELRKWYQAMLKKAARESIVMEVTNLYDLFFVPHGDSKVTAARLPYFDGDYWPGIAENMLKCLEKEDGEKLRRKGKSRRALEETECPDHSKNMGKDVLLMQKLGKSVCAGKERFMFINLVFTCTHCFQVIVSGTRWSCNICKSFHLCERCHDFEQSREKRENHHVTCKENHPLCQVEVCDIPAETEDKDEIMESMIFDTRETFLRFCATNFYQFDTLRRAKHSSMMLLFHLHNPEVPAFATT